MKRIIILATVCLLVAGTGYFAIAAEQEKPKSDKTSTSGKQIAMTGNMSCTFCKLAHPDMTCKPDCCTTCVKAGDPPMLTDAEGNMYILLTGEQGVSLMNPARMKLLGGQVTVKGLLVKGKGIQAIYVDSMEKVEAKPAEKK
ncbi:MAG: hypothetical protein ABSG97_08230 [Sedimentisphaerales bacterium]|jgi:hypothetical protein